MSFFTELKNAKEKVTFLLEQHPHLRDDDMKLIATFYLYEGGGKEVLQKETAYWFLQNLADGKYTQPECIRRNRAIIQSDRPDLRGTVYNERHKLGEEVASEINC